MVDGSAFNGPVSETFGRHEDTVRGHIRYELIKRNLAFITGREALDVLDVGGGSGIDAVWLSAMGHRVTVLDPAEDQLARAESRLAGISSQQSRLIRLRQGTADDLLAENKEYSYDLVLSHGVAMYVAEPALFIRSLACLVKPRRWISLFEKGFYGARSGLVAQSDYNAAVRLENSGRLKNHLDREVWAFKPEELIGFLYDAGIFRHADWSGIRVGYDADDRQVSSVKPSDLQNIVESEYQAGRRPDLRAAAPMLHVIAS